MKRTLFFSWQSDFEPIKNTLRKAISKAIKSLPKEDRYQLHLDESTKNLSGAINISDAINTKIKNCDIFIADTSIVNYSKVNEEQELRIGPNPNVIFELGFAAATIGWERIIMVTDVSNKAHKQFQPFDTRQQRMIEFDFNTGKQDVLQDKILDAIKAINKDEVSNLRIKEFANGNVHRLFLQFFTELSQLLNMGPFSSTLKFTQSLAKYNKSKLGERLLESRVLGFYVFRSIQPHIRDIEKLLDRPMLTKYLTRKTESILISLMTSIDRLGFKKKNGVAKVRDVSSSEIYNQLFFVRPHENGIRELYAGNLTYDYGEFETYIKDLDLKSIYRFKKNSINNLVDLVFEISSLYQLWRKEIGWIDFSK